jgi:Bacterial regulatory proteins, tetR family
LAVPAHELHYRLAVLQRFIRRGQPEPTSGCGYVPEESLDPCRSEEEKKLGLIGVDVERMTDAAWGKRERTRHSLKGKSRTRTRRADKAERTRQAILQAASELFAAQGLTATTISAIATEADVAAETIYSRFGNKLTLIPGLASSRWARTPS